MKVEKITKDSIEELLSKTPWDLDNTEKFISVMDKKVLEGIEYKVYLYKDTIEYEATKESSQSIFYSFAFFILEPPKEIKESYMEEIKKKEAGENYEKKFVESYISKFDESYYYKYYSEPLPPTIKHVTFTNPAVNFLYELENVLKEAFNLDKQKKFNYYHHFLTKNNNIAIAFYLIEIKKLSEKKIKE